VLRRMDHHAFVGQGGIASEVQGRPSKAGSQAGESAQIRIGIYYVVVVVVSFINTNNNNHLHLWFNGKISRCHPSLDSFG
jgi:hypothetical protein